MSIRSSVGIFGGMAVFFVGLIAVGMQADIVRPRAMNSTANGSSAAYNTSQSVFEGVGGVGGQTIAIAGVAAFLLLSIGLWYAIYAGGR